MVDLLLITAPESIYTYQVNNGKYELINVKGATDFPYDRHSSRKSVSEYLDAIKEECGYESLAPFTFKVAFSDDSLENNFMRAIAEHTEAQKEDMNLIATKIFSVLKKDKKLRINDFGANIGWHCYRQEGNSMYKMPFSLLAYTVTFDNIGEYLG